MRNAGQNKHLGIRMHVVVFVRIVHVWRVIQLETEDQAPHGDFFSRQFWADLGGAIVESVRGAQIFSEVRIVGSPLSPPKHKLWNI